MSLNRGIRNLTTTFLFFGIQFLKQSNATKFLGAYLDEHLTWKLHISFVCTQIAKSDSIKFRSPFYLSSKTSLILYYVLIYPFITYCNTTWSSAYVYNLNRNYFQKAGCARYHQLRLSSIFSSLRSSSYFSNQYISTNQIYV